MAIYTIAQLAIHDRDRYQRYISAFLPVLTQYGGRVLAADDNPEVIDGPWHGDRVVLLEFPDRDSYVAWATSAEYQHIATDRTASADMVALLVHGLS